MNWPKTAQKTRACVCVAHDVSRYLRRLGLSTGARAVVLVAEAAIVAGSKACRRGGDILSLGRAAPATVVDRLPTASPRPRGQEWG